MALKIIKKYPLLLPALLLVIVLPWVSPSAYIVRVFIEIFFFAAMGNAWNIIGGFGRQTSWASATFFSVGAYTSVLLFVKGGGISPWISAILGMAIAALLALIIGLPCFRLRGVFFSIATIACATIFRQLLIYFEGFTGGSLGLTLGVRMGDSLWNLNFLNDIPFYYIALIWMIVSVGIVIFIERNKLGYYLRAICEDQDAAEALGIRSSRVKLLAFVISCIMLAFTGTLYAFKVGFIDPNVVASHDMSIRVGIVAILGGMGTKWGPIIGALISVPLLEISNAYLQNIGGGGLGWVVYGLIIVLVVLFRPKGLISIWDDVMEKIKAKKARQLDKGGTV
ncbi:MAG TPA: branched-chain amino acid ABC transporter permease [Candidatus Pelethocola excrementipullorum]|nr:branched-chain amino acid ABC transporter permease [Candidatus Pelethocola excrementipullorum]